jgi:hypothetical protein
MDPCTWDKYFGGKRLASWLNGSQCSLTILPHLFALFSLSLSLSLSLSFAGVRSGYQAWK